MTPRQTAILRALSESAEPMSANGIGYALGFRPGEVQASIPKHSAGGGCIRSMGPAQRVNFPLTALRRRGLVGFGRRPDGRSGTAYVITADGRAALAGTADGG